MPLPREVYAARRAKSSFIEHWPFTVTTIAFGKIEVVHSMASMAKPIMPMAVLAKITQIAYVCVIVGISLLLHLDRELNLLAIDW